MLASTPVVESLPVTLLYVRGGDKNAIPLDSHVAAIASRYGARVEIVAPEQVEERYPNAAEFAPAVLVLRDGRLVGEAIADQQLKNFARNSDDKSAVCQVGLWKYSRHPNYFFQSLLWWGLFLAALAAPNGWIAILAPLAMLYTLLRVTGIPLTEKLSVKKRGDNYRHYQQTTSAFVPFPPKS